jgi:hypothetical protein
MSYNTKYLIQINSVKWYHTDRGPSSVVGIATSYGLDGQGNESRGGEIFRNCPDRPWGPPSLLYNGYRVFSGGVEWPERDADPSPPSTAVVIKEYSYTSTPNMSHTACTEPQCLYKGARITLIVALRLLFRCQTLTVMNIKITVMWDVAPCSVVHMYQYFEWTALYPKDRCNVGTSVPNHRT